MPFLKGENQHRPAPGSMLKVEPIRDKRGQSMIGAGCCLNTRSAA